MKTRWLLVGFIICSIMLSSIVYAKNQYYGIDGVYYNDEQVIGDAAKPTLKIGEPFSVAVEMTMYQYCQVYLELSDLGTGSGSNCFVVIDGPSDLGKSYDKLFLKNETHMFEWTLKPTDEWAGGAMPINFHYEIAVPDKTVTVVNSEFTIAVPYITTEYYEGDTITTTDPESPTSTEDPTTPSTPAFTILAAVLVLTIAARRS